MPIQNIAAPTLKRWLDHGEAIVVDVREPAEYAAENIEGSVLLPLAAVSKQTLPPLHGKKLVIHCRSGKRGATACEKLLAEDPKLDIHHLDGGILAWTQAGMSVQASGKFFLPLDRQVQLIIGASVLTGSTLAYYVHPAFLLLTAFFGLGLTIAGLTGFCGLALLIAKLPWNQKPQPASACAIKQ